MRRESKLFTRKFPKKSEIIFLMQKSVSCAIKGVFKSLKKMFDRSFTHSVESAMRFEKGIYTIVNNIIIFIIGWIVVSLNTG